MEEIKIVRPPIIATSGQPVSGAGPGPGAGANNTDREHGASGTTPGLIEDYACVGVESHCVRDFSWRHVTSFFARERTLSVLKRGELDSDTSSAALKERSLRVVA